MARELHKKSSAKNNSDNRVYRESGFDPGTCGLWAHHVVESRKGADILHGHDSKAC